MLEQESKSASCVAGANPWVPKPRGGMTTTAPECAARYGLARSLAARKSCVDRCLIAVSSIARNVHRAGRRDAGGRAHS